GARRSGRFDLEERGKAAAEMEERRPPAAMARRAANAKLEELLVERNQAEEDLADAAGKREQATAALYRLRSAADRLELRREAAEALLERLRAEPLRLPTVDDEQLRMTRERLAAVARALAEGGARLALAELGVEPGRERAVAAALGARGSALLAEDVHAGMRLLEQAMAAGLGNLTVLVGARPAELVEGYAVVPR